MGLFSSNTNSYLGIDIGSTSIKVVELKKAGSEAKLLTYGYSENINYDNLSKRNSTEDVKKTAKIISNIRKNADTVSHHAVSALPAYSVFQSVISLADLNNQDVSSAINLEAKKIIPLPLEEMILDWKEIEISQEKGTKKYLLTGAPKVLVKKYIDIFKEAQLNLISLETETFSLIRSLIGNDKNSIMIVEIGANTTDMLIVDNRIPLLSHSIDLGGIAITKAIADSLKIGFERAEQFKYDLGINSLDSEDDIIPATIIETISPIINELKYSINLFQSKNNKAVEKIILSGGSSLLRNLPNYLSKVLNIKVVVSSPWSRVSYPIDIKPVLAEIGPKMSVAVGLALRQIY